jgi:hypothetical protein
MSETIGGDHRFAAEFASLAAALNTHRIRDA